jgi:hypothetical protein
MLTTTQTATLAFTPLLTAPAVTSAAGDKLIVDFNADVNYPIAGNTPATEDVAFIVQIDGTSVYSGLLHLAQGTSEDEAITFESVPQTAGAHTVQIEWGDDEGTANITNPDAGGASPHGSLLVEDVSA